jgi:hypothetical protein
MKKHPKDPNIRKKLVAAMVLDGYGKAWALTVVGYKNKEAEMLAPFNSPIKRLLTDEEYRLKMADYYLSTYREQIAKMPDPKKRSSVHKEQTTEG